MTTPGTHHYYRRRPVAFKACHSDLRSPAMESFITVQNGQITNVVDGAKLFTMVNIKQPWDLENIIAPAIFRAATILVFGVIGIMTALW